MSAYFSPLKHITDVLDDDRRKDLSRLRLGIGRDEKKALGFPLGIGTLDHSAALAFGHDPKAGTLRIGNNLNFTGYDYADEAMLAKALVRINAFSLLMSPRNISAIMFGEGVAKIKGLRPLVENILKFDRETFGGDKVDINFNYDHNIVAPGKTRTAYWHGDGSSQIPDEERKLTRAYILKPNLPTEFIREERASLDGRPHPLLYGIANAHLKSPEIYAEWEAALREQKMFFQPSGNQVTLMTDETYHRSHQPNEPTPSSFMRLSIRPILGR